MRKQKVIAIDESGVEVPGKLVADVKTHWKALTAIRVNARRGRKGYQPLQVISLASEEEVEGLDLPGQDVSPISVARDAYAVAQTEAEDSGGGFFKFQGLAEDTEAGGAVVLFERSLKVEVDTEGAAEEVHEDPTASILSACAATVDRFGSLVSRAVEMNLRTQEQTAAQLAKIREQVFEQAQAMRGMDETRLKSQRDMLEHEAQLARTAALAESLSAGVSMLVPQLAQVLADRASKAPPEPPAATETAPEPDRAPTPCAESGALARVLGRLSSDAKDAFLAQFDEVQREIIRLAADCSSQVQFDGLVADLFRAADVEQMPDALATAKRWLSKLPPEAQSILVPQMMGVSARLQWPLSTPPRSNPEPEATDAQAREEPAGEP